MNISRFVFQSGTSLATLALLAAIPVYAQQEEDLNAESGIIVVTAQKREEQLQDVPVPVTALTASTLVQNNQPRLQDYYSVVPGLNLTLDNRGAPSVSIRGLSTTIFANPTVATVIDDVPFSGSTSLAFSWAAAEIDPNELERVEVLRGPQGVLYGASSLGGLIKYVTIRPSTDSFGGRAQVLANTVTGGDNLGYSASAALNIPVNDKLAVRVSGYHRNDPGYVDNVLSGEEDVNEARATGARISTLWEPSPDVSLLLTGIYQRSETDGSPNVDKTLKKLQQRYIRGTGAYERELYASTATLEIDFGGVDLVAISGYAKNRNQGSFDTSNLAITQQFSNLFFGTQFTAFVEDNETKKFSQELRLSGSIGSDIDWLLGGFYTREKTTLDGGQNAFVGLTGQRLGAWFTLSGPVRFRELAGFANITFRLTDRFDVQLGGRYSGNRQRVTLSLGLGLDDPATQPTQRSEDTSFTYLVTPRFKINDDMMLYARLATGYRAGGINTEIGFAGTPLSSYGPDTTRNIEIGFKGDLLDRRLTIDASIYDIQWSDLQITLADDATASAYQVNLGKARSRGVELSLAGRPTDRLTISGWIAYTDAQLTRDFPANSPADGKSGDRLPYNAKFSGSASIEQRFPVSDSAEAFVGGTLIYVGRRLGDFGTGREVYPDYTRIDLRAGVELDDWTVNFYVNNLTNRRALLGGGVNTLNANAFTIIQPRAVGLSVATNF